jgi:hypothetical protein
MRNTLQAVLVTLIATTVFASVALECAPGDFPEGEPICHDDYVDQFNSGCGGEPPVFQPIACGTTICGTSGTFLRGDLDARDTDWFELAHEGGGLTLTATAEFPIRIMLLDAGSGDCSDYVILDWDDADPDEPASIHHAPAPAGLYWLWIAPAEFTGWPCGGLYRVTVTCAPSCPADLDGDETVDVTDLLALLAAWGTVGADLNDDGTTDVGDLLLLLAAWGPCGG